MANDDTRPERDSSATPSQSTRGDGDTPEEVRVFTSAARLHRQGKLEEALNGYAEAIRINPRFAEPYNNMGVLLRRMGRGEAAAACYRRALALKPGSASFLSNLGNVLRELGQHESAAANHQRAVNISPNTPEPIYNLGLVLRDMGHLREALGCFTKAISLKPDYIDAHWDHSLTLLQMGHYEDGFREYEWRWRLPNNTNRLAERARWDGAADIAGKTLLLQQEQGMGDMIQFIRYARLVKECGARQVIVECAPPLSRLFATAPGVDRIVLKGDPLPPFDFYVPVMSLAAIFGTTLDAIPGTFPYLSAPSIHNVRIPVPNGTLLKIGIAWAGKPTHQNDRNRSCPLEHFIKLTGFHGAAFYSLQVGPHSQDLNKWSCQALVSDLSPKLGDFADTAAAMQQLDLVVAVDTSVIHLAGALGKEVWALLPYACDWRWLSGRSDTPWYPSMKLFRQDKAGDWKEMFEKKVTPALGQKLKALATNSGDGRPRV